MKIATGRIRNKLIADEAQQKRSIDPKNLAEQQSEAAYEKLHDERIKLVETIEGLIILDREYLKVTGGKEPASTEYLRRLRLHVSAAKQRLANLLKQEPSAKVRFEFAKKDKFEAQQQFAKINGRDNQIISEIGDLSRIWNNLKTQCSRAAVMLRITQIAHEKKILSNVNLKTNSAGLAIKYQLVDGGPVDTVPSCSTCLINPHVGLYYIWAERNGQVVSNKAAYLLAQERYSITINAR